jgi:hypothetical protein
MSGLLTFLFAFVLCPALFAQTPAAAEPQRPQQPQTALHVLPLMREYLGVKLGMNHDAVEGTPGETTRAGMDWGEFKLGGSDLMTVHYDDKGAVKTIQLYFTNPAHAPKWTQVVGAVTTVTLSRSPD